MKIKVHEGEKKAIVRFVHPAEIEWFKQHMAFIRDSDPKTHPPITLKNRQGTIRFPKPKPIAAPMVNPDGSVKIDPKHPQNIQAIPINPQKATMQINQPKVEALPPLHRGEIKPEKKSEK